MKKYSLKKNTKYTFDCEYNRDVDDPKKFDKSELLKLMGKKKEQNNYTIDELDKYFKEKESKSIYPDFVIHKRGVSIHDDPKANLVVIEIKTSINITEENLKIDCIKLKNYIEQFRYDHAFFLVLNYNYPSSNLLHYFDNDIMLNDHITEIKKKLKELSIYF